MPLCHRATASLPEIFPTTWVWIWLVNANQHSSDWLIVPTTANQITGIEKPNYHKTLIFSPTTSLKWSHEARIDELVDSNEPAINVLPDSVNLIYWPSSRDRPVIIQSLWHNLANWSKLVSKDKKLNTMQWAFSMWEWLCKAQSTKMMDDKGGSRVCQPKANLLSIMW